MSTIHSIFAARAAECPHRIALTDDNRNLTYAELDAQAARIAAFLRHHGVVAGTRVGLYSQRSIEAIAGILGILKVGAAYVPFDPSYPEKLLAFMHADCAPVLILVDPSLLESAADRFKSGTVHSLGVASAGAPLAGAAPTAPVGGDDPAYVMYTSGSTGHPKGVIIPHRGVVRLVIDNPFAAMGPGQVHLQLAPLAFDASTFEIWGALLNGGGLAILPDPYPSLDAIAAAIANHRVTTLWLTAGLFHLMVDHRLEGLRPLQQLIAGGDVLSPSHVARALAGLPGCQLINGYGPTENTTFTCCYRIPRDGEAGPIPIGTPIARTTVHILDEDRRPVSDGDCGELYAGGDGLALGYLNREDLTAERFVANPSAEGDGSMLYRTGDRVRRRSDGNLEFLGRVDRQVKVNGKRVELDEVEALIRRCPTVEDCAVTYPVAGTNPRRIHAYIKFREGGDVRGLREFLRAETVEYMIPSTFTPLDALPLSANGKIDRTKLPAPRSVSLEPAVPSVPGNAVEDVLQRIWRSVLETGAIGVDDNFFDLGGTSLQLIQVHAAIQSALNTDLTVVDLFRYPRISALASRLKQDREPISRANTLEPEERALRGQAALARARARGGRRGPR